MKLFIPFPTKDIVSVVMLDDDNTPFSYVAFILHYVFDIELERARIKCNVCDEQGYVLVGRYIKSKADKMINKARLLNMLHEQLLKFEIKED